MFTFMIATLGSLVFWVIYFMITLVMGIVVMRKIAPGTFESITTGEKQNYNMDWGMYTFIALGVFIFWPVIVVFTFLVWIIKHLWILIFFKIMGPGLLTLFKTIDKMTPDISINIKKE